MSPVSCYPSIHDTQLGTPYPRSAGFDTDNGAFIESSIVRSTKDRWLVCRLTATSASSSPARLVTLARPRTALCVRSHVRTMTYININSDLSQDHGGIIHGARGLNVNIALERPCCFSGQQTCIRRHRLLECRSNDCFRGIVRN